MKISWRACQMLRQASESVQQQGAEFHYVLRSLWPINPKNAPETDTEKTGLQYRPRPSRHELL